MEPSAGKPSCDTERLTSEPGSDAAFDTATVREVVVRGATYSVRELGPADGQPILLLHGFPETGRSWRRVAPTLAEAGLRVFMPDLKGYGRSSKPKPGAGVGLSVPPAGGVGDYRVSALAAELGELVPALGYDRIDVVGHDWGGILVSAMTRVARQRVNRIAILNAPFRWFVPWAPRHVYEFNIPGLPERRFWREPIHFVRDIVARWSANDPFDDADVREMARSLQFGGSFACAMAYYRGLPRDLAFLAPALWSPPRDLPEALVLFGARDPIMPRFVAERAHVDLVGSTLVLIDDAGHFVQSEAPERVTAALLDFVRRGR
ncbi:MAG: alpha/beta hydrolase [Myxococcales bacterium]|nr:alpha/beta hydrolase [Myxococcales bacterium]